eukprot:COSAG02_NODE_3513_length_6629_cov_2.342266_7_plen_58_part_00
MRHYGILVLLSTRRRLWTVLAGLTNLLNLESMAAFAAALVAALTLFRSSSSPASSRS